jgi:hypothetical protein
MGCTSILGTMIPRLETIHGYWEFGYIIMPSWQPAYLHVYLLNINEFYLAKWTTNPRIVIIFFFKKNCYFPLVIILRDYFCLKIPRWVPPVVQSENT